MAAKDNFPNLKITQSLAPQVITTGTPSGTAVDTAGYESVVMVLDTGTQAGTSNTFKFQAGAASDGSDAADIAVADLIGAATATAGDPIVLTTANDIAVHRRGYRGTARYVRIIASASSSGNLPCSAYVILGHPRNSLTS